MKRFFNISAVKKAAVSALAAVMALSVFAPTKAYATLTNDNIELKSKAAIVIDADTGAVLYEKNADQKIYPASTTKILTLIIALENTEMTDKINVSQNAMKGQENNGTHMGLHAGEVVTMDDALYGMMLESANDAAIAIAEHIGGSEEKFAKIMNDKIKELGLKDTHFVTSNGLYDKDHYTTASDMAKIMDYCIENEEFVKVCGGIKHTLKKTNKRDESYDIYTNNKMSIGKSMYYENWVCGKNGYIDESKCTLVTYAKKNGKRLISYVAGHSSPFDICEESEKILNSCFESYRNVSVTEDKHGMTLEKVIKGGDYVARKSQAPSDSITVSLYKTQSEKDIEFKLNSYNLSCPVSQGRVTGHVEALCNGDLVGSADLTAKKDLSRFGQIFSMMFKFILLALAAAAVALAALIFYNKEKKQKRPQMHGQRNYDKPARRITPDHENQVIHHTYHNTKKK
ncbi:MAG: D-alanyl-D-alanine carboxypeptidase family protein [Eubacterium sp.]|nr:D-alanyl-D-alanine carboxypeptidase family protein [Eubacterium sp.]